MGLENLIVRRIKVLVTPAEDATEALVNEHRQSGVIRPVVIVDQPVVVAPAFDIREPTNTLTDEPSTDSLSAGTGRLSGVGQEEVEHIGVAEVVVLPG